MNVQETAVFDEENVKEWTLEREQEFRFEVDWGNKIQLQARPSTDTNIRS